MINTGDYVLNDIEKFSNRSEENIERTLEIKILCSFEYAGL